MYLSSKHLDGTGLAAGYYEFGADGKMIVPEEEEPEVLNGPQADGTLYINGVKQLAYQLVEYEGDYYFISDYHKYAVNKRMYLSSKHLEKTGLAAGYYEFGTDGKMIIG